MTKAALIFLFSAAFNFSAFSQGYFQQEVNSKINATLNDTNHTLSAHIQIEYINNSPDNLNEIYIHLWPNAYRNNQTALGEQLMNLGETDFYFADEKQRGFIDSLDFKVNGEKARWHLDQNHIDIAKIILSAPLAPGDQITISTPFFVKIPVGTFSRLGHIGQSYQMTQWYPKPAVYDNKGWHQMPYLHMGEFYSEFGSFEVSITLPENYVVGATGDLINNHQERMWLDKKVEETQQIEKFPQDNSFPPSSPIYKTLTFFQKDVHDFAWFADKRYHVLRGDVELPKNNKKVELWAMFTNAEAHLWKNSIEYLKDATLFYSNKLGDYPYNHVTAVDGSISAGAGMEYPNITVIGTSGNAFTLENVIVHEVGHNWFYGILGSNERIHPWMDEGINSFYELLYFRKKYPQAGIAGISNDSKLAKTFGLDEFSHKTQYELAYLINARRNLDQPIELPAAEYTMLNYGAIVYSKSAIVFDYLRAYLGDELFDKAMHDYYETWKFKHPYPEDLKNAFEESVQQKMPWFFHDIINTTGKINYKLKNLKQVSCNESQKGSCYEVEIVNKGDIASPVSISAVSKDSVLANYWFEGFSGTKTFNINLPVSERIIIDAEKFIPEINRRNGFSRTSGLLKKANPLQFQLLGGIEHPVKKQIFFTPILGWNNYNKLMVGMAFYNNVIPQKKFEYVIAPMFSFGTKREAGIVNLNYNIYPDKGIFEHIRIGLNGEKFAISSFPNVNHYNKIQPAVHFHFKEKDPLSSKSRLLTLRSVNIFEDYNFPQYSSEGKYQYMAQGQMYYYVNEANFRFADSRALNPYNYSAFIQQGQGFLRANFEANYRFSYKQTKKGVDIRFFAGQFLYNDNADNRFNFGMAGNTDYMYDHVFLGRNDASGIFSKQFPLNDGGFKNYTTLAFSDDWLSSINIKAALPARIPLSLYADFGLTSYAGDSNINYAWNTGVALIVVRDIFEIYFPVAMSSELNQLSYFQKVRFMLNLHQLNPFNFVRKFEM